MSRTYLITGGAGFIGSNLTDLLLKQGINIVCVDNFDNFYSRKIKEGNIKDALTSSLFTFIEADIRDKKAMEDVFSKYPIDLVIHLAAKTGVRPSILNSMEYFDVNVNGTLVLLEAMKTYNVRKMIFASSSSVYGNNEKIPYSETDNVDYPISPYAASKKSCELITHSFYHLNNFDIINLRLFTVYGPRQRPDLAIHKFIMQVYNNEPLSIFGNGDTARDYTFIDDIIIGIKSAIQYCLAGNNIYEIINLGNNKPVKLKDLTEIIYRLLKKEKQLIYLSMQPGDVDRTYADITKAGKLLNYLPKTNIESGVQQFIKWYIAQRPR